MTVIIWPLILALLCISYFSMGTFVTGGIIIGISFFIPLAWLYSNDEIILRKLIPLSSNKKIDIKNIRIFMVIIRLIYSTLFLIFWIGAYLKNPDYQLVSLILLIITIITEYIFLSKKAI